MTAYSRRSRGPRVDSGVAGIRTTLAAARSHQAPAAARRFPVRQRGPGGVQRAVGRQGESRVCPPPAPAPCSQDPHNLATPPPFPAQASRPRRPAPPARRALLWQRPRPRAGPPRWVGAPAAEPPVLTGMVAACRAPPMSPLGMQPNNTGFAGEAGPRETEAPRGSRDCGSLSDGGQCAGAL